MRKTLLLMLLASLPLTAQAEQAADHEARARQTAQSFARELGAIMQREMQAGGPQAAIRVCSDQALQIAGRISRETGWQVRRIGTRVRNPLIGLPDVWEQQALADLERRLKGGADAATLSHAEEVSEPNGKYFRYVQAIVVNPPCLACHGPREQIAKPIREMLDEHYPHDRATGYQAGDLRGAISIKIPL